MSDIIRYNKFSINKNLLIIQDNKYIDVIDCIRNKY